MKYARNYHIIQGFQNICQFVSNLNWSGERSHCRLQCVQVQYRDDSSWIHSNMDKHTIHTYIVAFVKLKLEWTLQSPSNDSWIRSVRPDSFDESTLCILSKFWPSVLKNKLPRYGPGFFLCIGEERDMIGKYRFEACSALLEGSLSTGYYSLWRRRRMVGKMWRCY